jgi:isochorismate hydrolase
VADGLADWLRPPAQPQGGNARSLPKHLQKPRAASEPERPSIVIAGCEAHVCLLQTALELLEQEFEVWVVTDACGSRTERNRDAAFDRLAGAGAELVTTEMVAFEWLRTAEHPAFKPVQALIR